MIDLFEHNRIAYESAIAMLTETGKAAIVHPTGTGKSFIGFKLCEDNSDKVICWLSPSDYIFKTQLENLKNAANGYEPENIILYTYAKLMLMSKEEIAEIKPDYIILDEFHRCGAEMWGQGVQNVLNTYPDVPILGLSATAIRYLDNQRDMADELFDGNIASEMTLGEAIVRGILNPPKYIQSVFSYQKDLDKYTRRVQRARNKVVRDAGERYLEALRRAIEKADGLDVIFDKHMTDRTGKYIVFCADKEHMDEMMTHTEWFAKIDKAPHIYSFYTEDPTASKSFVAFKKDDDDTHLRLLYAIDALNEGVHVEDISGVILLRPTISPIIFKQQIGRALSASKKKEPIIFDIVNNIENLYSIGSIEEEMRAAIPYYLYLGEGMVVNERFTVIDEVKSCRELFEQLDDTLSASWDMMYDEAKAYYEQYGDLDVPSRYKTIEGYSLGSWLSSQRKVRAGEQLGYLDDNRIAKLDAIGMRWESAADLSWQRFYDAAKKYYEENGDLNVKALYVSKNGVRLGQWISNIRTYKRSGIKSNYLAPERIAQLEEIGMIWDQPDYIFERNFAALVKYHQRFGDANAPVDYVTEDGIRLGVWLHAQKSKIRKGMSTITDSQIERLSGLGVTWDTRVSMAWERGIAECKKFISQNGHLNVHCEYVTSDGYQLGKWVAHQRTHYRKGNLTQEKIKELESLGMAWDKSRANDWNDCYTHLCAFREEHGHIKVPTDYKADGIWLNKWLNEQKQIYYGKRKGKSLTEEQIKKLESVGMDWRSKSEQAWDKQYADLLEYYRQNGNIALPHNHYLSQWVIVQRKKRKKQELTQQQIDKLDAVGMIWEIDDGWENGFAHAKAFVETNGHAYIPTTYTCDDGYNLGTWWDNQRGIYNGKRKYGSLSKDQMDRLEALGMEWDSNLQAERSWMSAYEKYKAYVRTHHSEPKAKDKSSGIDLHEWLRTQREKYRKGRLDAEKIRLLEEVPIDWLFPVERKWETTFAAAERYFRLNGNLQVPVTYVDDNGVWLGRWVRQMHDEQDELTTTWANGNKRARLSAIGMKW